MFSTIFNAEAIRLSRSGYPGNNNVIYQPDFLEVYHTFVGGFDQKLAHGFAFLLWSVQEIELRPERDNILSIFVYDSSHTW